MMKRILIFGGLCCAALLTWATEQYTIGTNGRYHSSYDGFEEYGDALAANGLNGYPKLSITLGTTWLGVYVDRANAFGLQAYDTMESYGDNVAVNGLVVVATWGTQPFVDRQNTFTMVTYDTAESYGDAANVNGLNGGANNGTPVVWNSAYVVH